MKRSHFGMLASVFGAAVLLAPGLLNGQASMRTERPKFLLTDKEAIVLNSAEIVAATNVLDAKWSPDGRYIAALRETHRPPTPADPTPDKQVSVVLWNSGSHTAHEVWSSREKFITAQDNAIIQWFADSSTVLVKFNTAEAVRVTTGTGTVSEGEVGRDRLLWITLNGEHAREITLEKGDHLLVSPTQPAAAIYHLTPGVGRKYEQTLQMLKPDGSQKWIAGLGGDTLFTNWEWDADGKNLLVRSITDAPADKQNPVVRWFSVDSRTSQMQDIADNTPQYEEKPAPQAFHIIAAHDTLKENKTEAAIHPLWLATDGTGKYSRLLLTAEGDHAELSPKGDAIVYFSHGAAWAAPLSHYPKAAWLNSFRQAVMSNARQVGLGLIMYNADYDGIFPPAGSISDTVNPYVKNSDLFDGFNYQLNGNTLGSIEKPAGTVMGTIDAPGGQAVLYVDGHVVWKSDE